MRPELALWDWNGTLLDDAVYGLAVRNKVFPQFGLPTIDTLDEYRRQFTFPVREYYRRGGVTDALFPAVARAWFDEYVHGCSTLRLNPGAAEAVAALAGAGVPQTVLSASERSLLMTQIGRFASISASFEDVLGLEGIYAASKEELACAYLRRKAVEPARCVLIGDTLHDAQVAQAVGARCVLVAIGHQGRDTLETAGVPVVDTLAEAIGLLV